MPENVTIDELYRLLKDNNGELKEIRKQTTETNGRVRDVEGLTRAHDRDIRDLKRRFGLLFPYRQQRAADRPDAITLHIPMNKATLTILITVVGGIVAAAVTAVLKLWGLT